MDALIYGHKIAEVTYKYKKFKQFNDGNNMLVPYRIKVKPRGTVRFVVDNAMNVIGFTANSSLKSDEPVPVDAQGKEIKPKANITTDSSGNALIGGSKLLTREKFMVLTIRGKDEDPRGTSLLTAAPSVVVAIGDGYHSLLRESEYPQNLNLRRMDSYRLCQWFC